MRRLQQETTVQFRIVFEYFHIIVFIRRYLCIPISGVGGGRGKRARKVKKIHIAL